MRHLLTFLGAASGILARGCDERIDHDQPTVVAAPAAAVPRNPANEDPPFDEWAGKRWTNSEVPYVIDQDGTFRIQNVCTNWKAAFDGDVEVTPTLTNDQVQAIRDGIAQLEALTPLTFIEKTKANPPAATQAYILYRNDDGSHADIRGMPTDGTADCVYVQDAGAGEDQEQRRLVLHETVHALGMAHEQQRPDRKTFLIVDTTCLDWSDKLYRLDPNGLTLTPYDYESVMQYSSWNGCGGLDKPGCSFDGADCEKPPWLKDTTCSPMLTPPTCTFGGQCDCRWIGKPMELSVHDVNALNRMYELPLGVNNDDDELGRAFAVADFDDDGYSDLAVGAPGNMAVFVWKGSAGSKPDSLGRLVAWMVLRVPDVTQNPMNPWSSGRFGASLVAGDFDDSKTMDLAVGAPGDTGDGSVFIFSSVAAEGGTPRLTLSFTEVVNQGSLGLAGSTGDRFGAALAAGDFDGDAKTDLAIGAPQRRIARPLFTPKLPTEDKGTSTRQLSSSGTRSGAVIVRRAASPSTGMLLTPTKVSGGVLIEGARFGAALAAGKLNGDGRDDLAVGSPERVTVPTRSGSVYLFVGTSTGLVGKQLLRPTDEASDKAYEFGQALALGDFDGSGTPQLAVGAPKRSYFPRRSVGLTLGSAEEAGAIYLFKFAATTVFNFSQLGKFYQDTPTAYNHVGGVLLTLVASCGDAECDGGGDGLVAGVPDAQDEQGVVKIFDIALATPEDPHQININPPDAASAGNRFGDAVAVGNFLPNASELRGRKELVVGQPGWTNGAGSIYVRNFDDTDDANHWTFLSQETASPE